VGTLTVRIRLLSQYLFVSVCGVLLLLHALLLFLFNSPDNPIKLALDPEMRVFGQIFYQNWSFFAPTPIDEDIDLLVRARTKGARPTRWISVEEPLIRTMQNNRMSAYELVLTDVSNSVIMAQQSLQKLNPRQVHHLTDTAEFRYLYRTGESIVKSAFPDRRFDDVQIAFWIGRFPRFTHRLEHTSNDRLFTLDWEHFGGDVDATGW